MVITYAKYLEENQYYEESFKIFEAGVTLHNWPAVYDIWLIYISKFIERYQGEKLERTRALFEQALEGTPLVVGFVWFIEARENDLFDVR